MSDYSAYVRSQTISDVEKYTDAEQLKKKLITVKTNDTVETALKVLAENSIISAPVVDEKAKEGELTDNGTPYVGIINVVDLLTAFAFQPVFNTYDTDTKLGELKEEILSSLVETQRSLLQAPVGGYIGVSAESKTLWNFDEKDSLSKLIDVFSVGVHRILVSHSTAKENYWSFVSQTDVLRYLKVQSYRRESKIGGVFLSKLSELKLGEGSEGKIITINEKASAITGFRLMLRHNELSALPVINDKGVLVNTLSASDFRGIGLDNFKDTLMPINNFLTFQRGTKRHRAVIIKPDEYLSSVVDKLLLTHVHRAWVVDSEGKPIGVVSLTDIIKTFSIYAPDETTTD